MRLISKLLSVGLVVSAVVTPVVMGTTAQAHRAPAPAPMVTLVDVMAHRVEIADTVAAAKWGTVRPIEDPVREETVLDNAAAQAPAYGVDPTLAVAVFADQIAANKVTQYGLFSRWTAYPGKAPTERPDLATVRPVLDAITAQLLAQLQATDDLRSGDRCQWQLAGAQAQVARDREFDQLHREALVRAGTSICP